jgi:two-component system, sensor histidine kinase FlrB
MMASMAHQVRTPLSTAILYASQLGKPAVQEGKRQVFAAKILERLHHLDRQVNDMLLFAKEGRLEMESFSLSLLLARLQDVMADYTLSGLIEFSIENYALEDEVCGNLDALQGALMNLLKNAIDAVIGGGSIKLRILPVECGLLVSIQDDGMGMESEAQQKIFEPFFTTKVNGMGLGLAVVASVIKAHGGEIQCTSAKGEGTEFSIFLPLTSDLQHPLASHFSAQVFPVSGGESCHNMMC